MLLSWTRAEVPCFSGHILLRQTVHLFTFVCRSICVWNAHPSSCSLLLFHLLTINTTTSVTFPPASSLHMPHHHHIHIRLHTSSLRVGPAGTSPQCNTPFTSQHARTTQQIGRTRKGRRLMNHHHQASSRWALGVGGEALCCSAAMARSCSFIRCSCSFIRCSCSSSLCCTSA